VPTHAMPIDSGRFAPVASPSSDSGRLSALRLAPTAAPLRGLGPLVAGLLLVALRLDLRVAGLPVGALLALGGAALAALGAWRLGASDAAGRRLGYGLVLGGLGLWAALQGAGLLADLPAVVGVVGRAAAAAAFCGVAWLLRAAARERAWDAAAAAWTLAFAVGAGVSGLATAGGLVAVLAAALGAEPDLALHHPALVGLALAATAAPVALFVRAAVRTAAARGAPGRAARALAHPAGAGALLALLLLPFWLLLPAWVHFERTPDFAAQVARGGPAPAPWTPAAPARAVAIHEGPRHEVGAVRVPADEAARVADDETTEHVLRLRVRHGDERLLDLEHALWVTGDPAGGVAGWRAETRRCQVDGRFTLLGQTVVAAAAEPREVEAVGAGDGRAERVREAVLPAELRIVLAAGDAPVRFRVERVAGLRVATSPALALPGLPAAGDALPGVSGGRGAVVELAALGMVGDGGPPPGEPVEYALRLPLRFVVQAGSRRPLVRVEEGEPRFAANTAEFSWTAEVETVERSGGLTRTTTRTESRERTWNGEVW